MARAAARVELVAGSASQSALESNLLRCFMCLVGHLVMLFNTIATPTASLQRSADSSEDSCQLRARSTDVMSAKESQRRTALARLLGTCVRIVLCV